jgi:hypothetical protein
MTSPTNPFAASALQEVQALSKTPQTKGRRLAMPRALLWKHTCITKKGRIKLKRGWSDNRIAKKANSEVGLMRRLRSDLYGRLRAEVVREPLVEK